MQKKLTAAGLDHLKEGIYWDSLTPGLHIRVGKNRKTWQLRFLVGTKYQFERLGYYPETGLAAARDKAGEIAKRIEAGVPVTVVAPVHPKTGKTMADLVDGYETYRKMHPDKPNKSLPEALRSVRKGLKDTKFDGHPAKLFTKADLRSVRDKLAKYNGPIASNRFMDYLRPMMKWAASEDIIEHDIAPTVVKAAGAVKRERTLSDAEVRAVWKACGEMGSEAALSYGRLVRFLLVTAQRRDEAASLLCSDVVGDGWAFDKNKASREQKLTLPRLALDQIKGDELAFPGRRGTKMSGWSHLKADLDKKCGVTGWTLHDLRRTASTGMQELAEPHIIEAVLNHAIPGVAGVYMRNLMLPQKAEALRLWARKLEGILNIRQLKVVS